MKGESECYVNKSKVIKFTQGERQVSGDVCLNGENLEIVDHFIYLRVDMAASGTMEAEVGYRLLIELTS